MSDPTSLGSPIDIDFFRENGYCTLQNVLTKDELQYYIQLYDEDREQNSHMWVPFQQGPHSQIRNCDPLVTSPHFDGLIRHPRILEAIEAIFEGEKCCNGGMPAVDGAYGCKWQRGGKRILWMAPGRWNWCPRAA